jgi:hypothetical protein
MWRTGEKTVLLGVDGVLAILPRRRILLDPTPLGKGIEWHSAGRSALDVVPGLAATATQSAMLATCSSQCLSGAVRGQGQCTRSRNVVTASSVVSDERRRLWYLWWFGWMVQCDAVARPPCWRPELGIFLAVWRSAYLPAAVRFGASEVAYRPLHCFSSDNILSPPQN